MGTFTGQRCFECVRACDRDYSRTPSFLFRGKINNKTKQQHFSVTIIFYLMVDRSLDHLAIISYFSCFNLKEITKIFLDIFALFPIY